MALANVPSMPQNAEAGLIPGDVAARLLLMTFQEFEALARKGWFKPELKNPARYRLVEVVQGHVKYLEHEATRGFSIPEIAAYLDMGSRNFAELVERNVIPRAPKLGYDRDECRKLYIRYQRSLTAGQGGHGSATLASERALLAREQRESAQIKNAYARGDLVSLAAVGERLDNLFSVMREIALTTPGKVADGVSAHTEEDREAVFTIVDSEIREMLMVLSTGDIITQRQTPAQQRGIGDAEEAIV